jgi:hypothetical protein
MEISSQSCPLTDCPHRCRELCGQTAVIRLIRERQLAFSNADTVGLGKKFYLRGRNGGAADRTNNSFNQMVRNSYDSGPLTYELNSSAWAFRNLSWS